MCAIFGFVARANRSIDLRVVRDLVTANVVRGPHAYGFAWVDSRGRLRCYKQTGRLTDRLGVLPLARDARLLVGHLRYATHGSAAEAINNHPHPCDGGWIVHNGIVHNHEELNRRHRLAPVSECDSETIGLMIEQFDGTLAARVAAAAEQIDGAAAVLGLWSRPATLIAIRRGNPLHRGEDASGVYFATMPDGLPDAVAVEDDTLLQLTPGRGQPLVRSRELRSGKVVRRGWFDLATYRGG